MMDENFGDASSLKDDQMKLVVDQCYQCKLCDPICPYVPPHEWDVDFPRTMMRASLVEAKNEGVSFADRMMGDTGQGRALGELGGAPRKLGQPDPVSAPSDGKVYGRPP